MGCNVFPCHHANMISIIMPFYNFCVMHQICKNIFMNIARMGKWWCLNMHGHLPMDGCGKVEAQLTWNSLQGKHFVNNTWARMKKRNLCQER